MKKTPTRIAAQTVDALVSGIRRGDVEAFETVVKTYSPRLVRVVMGILKNPSDAEEVVQDVFLTVFRKIDYFRGEASFSTWLHRIAVNAALMQKRRDRSGTAVPLDDVLPALDAGSRRPKVGEWIEKPRDTVLRDEAWQVIHKAVDRLDHKYKTVYVLREFEGCSTEETAKILALKVPAVKSRPHRARFFLRRELATYFERQVA